MDGNNSGLFTPSRRALAGGAARKSAGEMDIPATRPYSADRRETEDVGMMLMSSDDVDDIAEDEPSRDDASMGELGMMGANASTQSTAWRRNVVQNASAMVDGGKGSEGSMGNSNITLVHHGSWRFMVMSRKRRCWIFVMRHTSKMAGS